ncbi:helix-turn-helix transcriptional regulator [Mycobacterium intracellulare]|uniref:helix-turn-helix domain-containing protein n=1 Tax=Mycobacterium intracellulare TaxID=1767 RepID=UPI001CD9198A|nr:helix-turn-helix transcriptional regulator [Mycobacterium intracellulare]MCA2303189.1 helix-turn-helix transcriptional regulator [Mycobacterium intracellulare]MCA2346464.1 helix-turn-helix transcriptional regulator [Mycobacterium intracellulare]
MQNIGEDWHRATAERIGKAVVKYRRDAGLTAQQLAERCRDLGVPIHRTTITKIEGGRSRFDLGELLILAAALEVPPMVLLYPELPGGEVELIPDRPASSWDAYLWATGAAPSFTNPGARPSKGAELLAATTRRAELIAVQPHLQIQAAAEPDEVFKAALKDRVASTRDEISRLSALIRDLGGVVQDA